MRRVVLILAVLSGLLCVGLVAACVYTNVADTKVVLIPEVGAWTIAMDQSGMLAILYEATGHTGGSGKWQFAGLGNFLGIWARNGGRTCVILFHYWLLISTTAILPALQFCRFLKLRHRRKHSMCLACGYDLRASKERCPECGTPTAAKASSTGRKCQESISLRSRPAIGSTSQQQ